VVWLSSSFSASLFRFIRPRDPDSYKKLTEEEEEDPRSNIQERPENSEAHEYQDQDTRVHEKKSHVEDPEDQDDPNSEVPPHLPSLPRPRPPAGPLTRSLSLLSIALLFLAVTSMGTALLLTSNFVWWAWTCLGAFVLVLASIYGVAFFCPVRV
jgi:hypothetical protein